MHHHPPNQGASSMPKNIPQSFMLPTIFDSPPLSTRSGGSSPDQSEVLNLEQHYLGNLLEKLNISLDQHEMVNPKVNGGMVNANKLFCHALKCSSPTNSVSSGANNSSFTSDYVSNYGCSDHICNDTISTFNSDNLSFDR